MNVQIVHPYPRCQSLEELTEAQLTNFTQRMASLEVPVIQLEMPPHQAPVFGPHGAMVYDGVIGILMGLSWDNDWILLGY